MAGDSRRHGARPASGRHLLRTAQLAGELDVAYQRLQEQVVNLLAGRPVEGVTIPMASFRGALDWPAPGRYVHARNGIEIMAPEGTSVTAIHPGTVDYADTFSGFGNMVIIDHGSNYFSLYGYLSSIGVTSGQHVDAGTELGKVGTAPSGPPSRCRRPPALTPAEVCRSKETGRTQDSSPSTTRSRRASSNARGPSDARRQLKPLRSRL